MSKHVSAILAVAIAIVCSLPAPAQMQTVPFTYPQVVTGPLTTVGDFVPINLLGGKWATAVWSIVGTAGSATITTEISIDGGTNWIPSAYSKRLDAVTANPSVVQWAANTGITGSVWETPLPGNATQFRLRCGGTGTTTNVQLYGGLPYVPGVPVVATLYDVTEGSIGAGLLTSTTAQDVSGWNSVSITAISPTSQVVTVRPIDDAGSPITSEILVFTAASSGVLTLNRFGGGAPNALSVTAGASQSAPLWGKRIAWYLPVGGTVSVGRIRVEASR